MTIGTFLLIVILSIIGTAVLVEILTAEKKEDTKYDVYVFPPPPRPEPTDDPPKELLKYMDRSMEPDLPVDKKTSIFVEYITRVVNTPYEKLIVIAHDHTDRIYVRIFGCDVGLTVFYLRLPNEQSYVFQLHFEIGETLEHRESWHYGRRKEQTIVSDLFDEFFEVHEKAVAAKKDQKLDSYLNRIKSCGGN